MDSSGLLSSIAVFGIMNMLFWLISFIVVELVPVFCLWRIYEKAGYAPQWSLFAFIPGGVLVLLLVLALLEW